MHIRWYHEFESRMFVLFLPQVTAVQFHVKNKWRYTGTPVSEDILFSALCLPRIIRIWLNWHLFGYILYNYQMLMLSAIQQQCHQSDLGHDTDGMNTRLLHSFISPLGRETQRARCAADRSVSFVSKRSGIINYS